VINLVSGTCWCCGYNGKVTRHHAIPQCLKPKKNQIIYLCKECHKMFHQQMPIMKHKKDMIKRLKRYRRLTQKLDAVNNYNNTYYSLICQNIIYQQQLKELRGK
jgi:hypothetical protein